MSKAFTFELVGGNRLIKALDKLVKEKTEAIDAAIETSVKLINTRQITLTPVDQSFLRTANEWDKVKKLDYELFNRIEYGPYVEFGTGGLVEVPKGLEDYAIQFKGAGIREVNLPARPFFFQPFFEEKKKLVLEIKKILTK